MLTPPCAVQGPAPVAAWVLAAQKTSAAMRAMMEQLAQPQRVVKGETERWEEWAESCRQTVTPSVLAKRVPYVTRVDASSIAATPGTSVLQVRPATAVRVFVSATR